MRDLHPLSLFLLIVGAILTAALIIASVGAQDDYDRANEHAQELLNCTVASCDK